jgi:hypothetical protein
MRRATTQKPGFFAKSGEDVKNIRETRFLGLSASGFTHSPKKPGFYQVFRLRSSFRKKTRFLGPCVSPQLSIALNSQNQLYSVLARNLYKTLPKKRKVLRKTTEPRPIGKRDRHFGG